MMFVPSLQHHVLPTLFIFGPILAYIPQYSEILKGDYRGFSTYVCFILLSSNTLRMFFWLGKRFDIELLYQALAMIITQLVMLEVVVRVRTQSTNKSIASRRTLLVSGWDSFWNWDDFISYAMTLLLFIIAAGTISFFFITEPWYVESLGDISLFVEATLGIPQIYNNYSRSSTHGLSSFLIVCWLAGDVFKTSYFLHLGSPFQFIMCGSVQICEDITILGQILWYSQMDPVEDDHETKKSDRTPLRTLA